MRLGTGYDTIATEHRIIERKDQKEMGKLALVKMTLGGKAQWVKWRWVKWY